MCPKNERERALLEYGYWKGTSEVFERILLKQDLIISLSEYNESNIIHLNRED